MQRYKKSLFLVLLISLSAQLSFAQAYSFTVVIDPGHGGRDPGAVGANSLEKNIVLAVGLKLGELIESNHPYVRVVFTRRTDVFVPLHERAEIANQANGDLFISIHCNAVAGASAQTAQGAEVFVLGMHRSDDNLAAAKRENAVIFLEEDYAVRYAGFDPNDPISYIIFEFLANEHLDRSIQFASLVQNQLVNSANRVNRGVRQAGFLVLREVAMPSVLVELGFISNREEERFMMSAEGQRILANSIYEGFRQYVADHRRRTLLPIVAVQTPSLPLPDPAVADVSSPPLPQQLPQQPEIVPQQQQQQQVILTAPAQPIHPAEPVREFRIQFLSSGQRHNEGASVFRGLSPVQYYRDGNLYRFTFGSTTCRDEINRLLPEVRQLFRDAFIIEKVNGIRVR